MMTLTFQKFAALLALCGLAACDDDPRPKTRPAPTVASQPTPPVVVPEVKPEPPRPIAREEKRLEPPVRPEPKGGKETLAEARRLLTEGSDSEGALKMARRAVRLLQGSFLAWNTLGRAELEMDHGKEAQEAFTRAIELRPESSYAHNNLGLAFLYEQKWEDALVELEKATSLEPQQPYMRNNLGIALEHLDRLDEARAAYQKAADEGAENARVSAERLKGVKTIKTARVGKGGSTTPDPDGTSPGTSPAPKLDGLDGGTR
jgi:tetratricopeptide (TPR) repeat protein